MHNLYYYVNYYFFMYRFLNINYLCNYRNNIDFLKHYNEILPLYTYMNFSYGNKIGKFLIFPIRQKNHINHAFQTLKKELLSPHVRIMPLYFLQY